MKYQLLAMLVIAAGLVAGCMQTNDPISAAPTAWVAQKSGTSQDIVDVFFVDGRNGWAVCRFDTVLRTTDAGITWTPHFYGMPGAPGLSLASIHFTDQYNGWGVGRGGVMMRTTDGGVSWEPHDFASLNNSPSSLTSIFFLDRNRGWFVGGTRFGVFRTTDGGENWSRAEDSAGMYDQLQSITFSDPEHGWAVGSRQIAVGNQGGSFSAIVARTVDGGMHWSTQLLPTAGSLDRVFFVDSLHGWAAGTEGAIFHTTDGGVTWRQQSTGTASAILSIFFVDASNGWAVIDRPVKSATGVPDQFRMILRTTDGGEQWRFQDQSVALSSLTVLLDIFFVDPQHGWAVGTNGTIWRTTTGGFAN